MQLPQFDAAAVARCLSQLAERDGDHADAWFERRERIELAEDGATPQWRVWRSGGFSLRLQRADRCWMAARDRFDRRALADALRQVARASPRAAFPPPEFHLVPEAAPEAPELAALPTALRRALRREHVAFPLRVTVRRHRRLSRWIDAILAPEAEEGKFYSVAVETPWGAVRQLLPAIEEPAVDGLVSRLLQRLRGRDAAPPPLGRTVVVLAPAAAATLLHEAVAHALETDTLALTGRPAAALGERLGPVALSVLDDPTSLPPGLRRQTDDEGMPARRRWLLRDGVVRGLLADRQAADVDEELDAGCGRRSDLGLPPVPRSTHLETAGGDADLTDLLRESEGGIYVEDCVQGRMDPLTGAFRLRPGSAWRIRGGVATEPLGPCGLAGSVGALAEAIEGVGRETEFAGAGWCAKGGHRMPVWATVAALRHSGLEVVE